MGDRFGQGTRMAYRLLGPVEVRVAGQPVAVGGPKVRALLAVLLLEANRTVSTDRLVEALWGDSQPGAARQNLHYLVHRLRRALAGPGGAQPLRTAPGGYLLEVGPGELDTEVLAELLAEARTARAGGGLERAAALLAEARDLWRGPPLAELAQANPAVAAEAGRLEGLVAAAVEERADVELALGRHGALVGELESMLRTWPLRERLRALLMLALYRSGRQADALAAYHAARQTLMAELGVGPGPELTRLEQAILTADPALDPPRPARAPASAPPAPPPPPAPGPTEERKVVTVLVAGLRVDAGPGDGLDPEDLGSRHAAAVALLERQVARFGGVVAAVAGATALAVFGTPVAHDDDPERAVRAALELTADDLGTGIRIGVDTGEALVTVDPGAGTVAVAGDVVERAGRLAAGAGPGAVAVGDPARRASRRAIAYEPAPAGWLATHPLASTGTAALAATPLIEREQELALLAGLLARARREREPQLVTLAGGPGIGKSRLVTELGALVDADPDLVTWRQGRCLPYGEGVTFWALGEIVKAHAGILESDSAEQADAKLQRAARDTLSGEADALGAAADPAEVDWVTRYLRLLAGPESDQPTSVDRRLEVFAAWRRLLEAMAGERPLVLVFEDLQWADDDLLDFIDELPDRVTGVPMLVVCTARPELLSRRPSWGGGKRNATTVSLPPLTGPGTSRLLASLLGAERLGEGTEAAVVASAGGNPLFVEAYVGMLRDLRRVGREVGQAGPDPAALPVPETVGQLLTARIDTLEPADKALLQDAAVLGQRGWVGAMAALSGAEPGAIAGWLHRLERRELLRRAQGAAAVAGETEFTFSHALVRDVAYGQLPRARRAERHRRAAAWLESLSPDRATDRAELLAHHWSQALAFATAAGQLDQLDELGTRARLALREAGDRAAALGAQTVAARFYQAALDLWPAADPIDEPGAAAIDEPGAAAERPELLLRLAHSKHYGDDTGREALTEARDALVAAGMLAKAAQAEVRLASLLWRDGLIDEAQRLAEHALEVARTEPPSPALADALSIGATFYLPMGDNERAMELSREAMALARRFGQEETEGVARCSIGVLRVRLGDLGGLDDLRAAAELHERLRSVHAEISWGNLATVLGWAGDLRAAAVAAEAARTATGRYRTSDFDARWMAVEQATEQWWAGRWEAMAAATAAVIADADSDPHYLLGRCLVLRGRLRLLGGDLDGALADGAGALERTGEVGDLDELDTARAFMARALLAAGRLAEARELAEALLEGISGRLLIAEVGADLPMALAGLGYPAGVLDGRGLLETRWLAAARRWLAGDPAGAADEYSAIGSLPDEAAARLAAGEAGNDEGQLLAALGFYDKVGAAAAAARAADLLGRLAAEGRPA